MTDPFPLLGPDRPAGTARGALIALSTPEPRVLLQLRDERPGVAFGGHWGYFGGGVEPGETLTRAATREFAEETGLTLAPDLLIPFARVVSSTAAATTLYVFTARTDLAPSALRLGEGAGFGFFTPAQAATLRFVPVLKPVLDAYLSHIA